MEIILKTATELSDDLDVIKEVGKDFAIKLKDGRIARPVLAFDIMDNEDGLVHETITSVKAMEEVGIGLVDYIDCEEDISDKCDSCKKDPEFDNKYDCSLCCRNYDDHYEPKGD